MTTKCWLHWGGLRYAFDFAIVCSLIGAVASLMRGGRYIHGEGPTLDYEIESHARGEAPALSSSNGPVGS